RLQEVPHDMRQKETLTPALIRTVAEWSIQAEAHFGSPQDVEWAVSGGEFFMLQSRAITVLGKKDVGEGIDEPYVIFKPLLENFTDPLTPISQDGISLLFAPPLIRLISGWTYLSVKHIRKLLPIRASDQDVASTLYDMNLREPGKLSLPKLPFFSCMMLLAYFAAGVLFARTRRMPDSFMDSYRALCEKVDNDPTLSPVETFERLFSWSHFLEPIGHHAIFINLTSMRYILGMDILKSLVRRWAPNIREDAEALLCSGTDGVLSAEMGRGIWALAKEAKRHPSVRRLFETIRPENVLAELGREPEAETFLKQLDHFLRINGHRALKELELQSSRWEEDPAPVLGMIRNYLLIESDPSEHEKKIEVTRKELEATIRENLRKYPLERRFSIRWRLIRYVADRTKFFTKMRENSRFYHIMGFYCIRKKILHIESELMTQRKLRCKDDIFYLRLKEIERMQAGELDWQHVEDRIRNRRMAHIRLSKTLPPKTVGMGMESSPETPADMDTAVVFHGLPASPGSYEGVARVILDPSIDIELRPGEILVAPYTDPAWTPLFLTAGAAVIEIGSYLSHAGTVAREFGMPCVVDLADCTKRIHTGVRIQVDGDKGIVRLLADDDMGNDSG
ncbi:MAG: PEP-utilizing enzyme, partial [Desulfobacterales bacterium]